MEYPQVECFSSSSYARQPTAVFWEGDRLEVEQVLAEIRTPRGKQFSVLTHDGRAFDLFYDEYSDHWRVTER
ncbi:MAG: hypothetical protein ACK2UW_07595 [Anaerolineales bacterium]